MVTNFGPRSAILNFAKKINDNSYRKFNIEIPDINYFDKKLEGQIEFRKKQFQKNNSI